MNPDAVGARRAVESLRSGVPSRYAVAQLGTTQYEIKIRFQEELDALVEGKSTSPLVVAANFGAGKTHLLEYLQTLAERANCVTSYVVVSPEMPLGNAHVVLKAIAEGSRAPGRTGKALRALMSDFSTSSPEYAAVREWARTAGLQDSFNAILHLYAEFRADETFRGQLLEDIEGKVVLKSILKGRLKEIGQAAAYDLGTMKGSRKTPELAHERIRLLAQMFRATGCHGVVILFDELERIAKFSLHQRAAAYQELSWWQEAAQRTGGAILPVFAMTEEFLANYVTGGKRDAQKFVSVALGQVTDEREERASRGIDLLTSYSLLNSPDLRQIEEIKYRVKGLYETAYGVAVAPVETRPDRTSIRSEIRRWITLWDLQRFDPDYVPQMQEETLRFDESEISDESLQTGDDDEAVE
jgi:hypothetical protein